MTTRSGTFSTLSASFPSRKVVRAGKPSRSSEAIIHRSPPPFIKLVQTVHVTNFPIVALVWSTTARYLAAAIQHGPIFLFTATTSPVTPLRPTPLRTFRGHTRDVLHLCFSPTHFLASASTDRSVRLWHPNSSACLRVLQHPDMATSVAFHPLNEGLLLTASCDGNARLWRLTDRTVISRASAHAVLTTAVFLSSLTAMVGTYDGRILCWRPPTHPSSIKQGTNETTSFSHTTLDVRRSRGRQPSRSGLSARLSAAVVASEGNALKRRIFVTCSGGRVFELDDTGILRRMRASSRTKRRVTSTSLPASGTSDGRFVILDAVGRSIRLLDLTRISGTRRKEKGDSVAVLEIPILKDATVTGATIAPDIVGKSVHESSSDKEMTVVMVVGGDDGSITIVKFMDAVV